MRFGELNWFDVESYLEKDDRVMLVLGSCEQHGYLSLETDVRIPQAIADAASQRTGVVIGPTVNFGVSPYFLEYPGTISLRIATLMDLCEDMVRSLWRHGFRRFLFLNGHGGNDPVRARIYELANDLEETRFCWYAWWQSHQVEEVAKNHGLKSYHGGWIEAFPFNQVADLPNGRKVPPVIPGLTSAIEAKARYGDGVFGGEYQVSSEIMEELFTTMVREVVEMLRFA